jgi:hypothetical protein
VRIVTASLSLADTQGKQDLQPMHDVMDNQRDPVDNLQRPPVSHWLATLAFVAFIALSYAWQSTHIKALGPAAWAAGVLTFIGYLYNRSYYRAFKAHLRAMKTERRAQRRRSEEP